MIIVFLLLTASFFLSLFHLYLYSEIVIAAACFVLILFITRKHGKIVQKEKYLLTPRVLESEIISDIIKSGILTGEFIVSSEYISSVLSNMEKNIQKKQSLTVLENVNLISRTGMMIKHKMGFSYMELFKYAYDNGCVIIMSGEKISANISKMFSVRIIDIAKILPRETTSYKSIAKVFAEKWEDNSLKGYLLSEDLVVVTDAVQEESGKIIDVEIEREISVRNRKVYYAKKK